MTTTEQIYHKLFGKYEIQSRIGTTGLATVYRALNPEGATVALKVPLAYFSREPEIIQKLMDVMGKVQEFQHPNIVPVYGVEHNGEATAIVMEFVTWPSLKAWRYSSLPLTETLHVLRQVASALDYAHQQGIIHQDLRPSNVFYNPETGGIKVSDFGTIVMIEGGHSLVRSTVNTPNPSYAAPEQMQGLTPSPKNDVYALGVLAYELLTGETPFDALSPHTVLARQLTSTPIPPSHLEEGLPSEVDGAILKALHRRVEERYDTCTEMVEALEEAVRPLGIQAAAYNDPGLAEAPPDVAQQEQKAIPLPLKEPRVLCPHCGTGNSTTASRCRNCWMTLGELPQISLEEELQREWKYAARIRRRKRRIRLVTALTLTAALAFWSYNVIEIRPPLAAPTTAISSESGENAWSMVQRNARHTGVAPGAAFVPEGTIKWQFESKGPILATPSVADGKVFVATSDRKIVAIDEESGDILWTHEVSGPINSSPAKAGDFVYVGQRDGQILALDANTGELRWSFAAAAAMYGSFTIVDGTLYTGSTDHNVYALDASTGKLRWKRETGDWLVAAPSVVDGIVVIGGQDAELYMFDASNGTLRNKIGTGTGIDSAPTLIGDVAYFTTRGGRVIAYDYRQKDFPFQKAVWSIWFQLWIWRGAPEPPNPPGLMWGVGLGKSEIVLSETASDGERLFVSSLSGKLRALDLETGQRLWAKEGLGKLRTSPIISGDTVIQVSGNGDVLGFDKATGEQLWSISIGETILASPVLANDTLYVATAQGNVYALRSQGDENLTRSSP